MTAVSSTLGPNGRRLAGGCGLLVVAIGALVLVGWATDSTVLKGITSSLPTMKPLAAIGVTGLGVALFLLAPAKVTPGRHRAGVAMALFCVLIGTLVIAEYAFGDLGIDELLFDDTGANPGRPGSVAAIALIALGLSLAMLDRGAPRYRASQVLIAVCGLVALAALIGFAFGVHYLRGGGSNTGLAVQGVVVFTLLALAIPLSRPDRGIVAWLRGDDPASTLARRLAPVAIVVPLALGGLRLAGESAGLFSSEIGLALVTFASTLILAAVITISARDVRVQSQRRAATERSFRAVSEASILAIVTADADGRITYLNPAAARMFGYSSREAAGLELTALIPESYRDAHEAGLRRFLETGERRVIGETVELAGLRRDGEEFPISISLVDWEADGRVHFTATITDISDRLQAEQSTRELAAIVENTADAVIGWNLDGTVRSWNRGAERIYGYRADEMIGRAHDVLMPPGQQSEMPEMLERVAAGGRVENVETSRMRKDWRRIDVALTVSPVLDEDGKVIAASTISRDISQQKAGERELAESARHFELINDLVATCGFDGYFKQLNGAWEQTLGWAPEQLLPNPFIEIIHPDDRAAVEAEVVRLAGGATTAEFKLRVGTNDGRWRWTEWSASPDLAAGRFYCVGREISDRMEVERALAAERRQLADAQQLASVGSWDLDVSTGERSWSDQQFRNHGFDPEGPIPTREQVVARIHPEDREQVEELLASLELDAAEFAYSYRVIDPDGSVRSIEVEGKPSIEPDGNVRLLGTSRDVTAERDADRLKDDFFGLISHELRTPLTSIIGYTELLEEIEAENLSEQGRRFVEVIERNSRRELSLVGDLLLLTKITAGTFEVALGRADLGEIVRSTAEACGPDAGKAGLKVVLDVDDAPVIEGDPHRLGQVLENLVSNAIKFTPTGGRVEISAGRDGDSAILQVTDTGIGIPPEDRDRLFERMFRAREAERRHIQGTGLGLTIAKAIVDAHHGTIRVDSDPGRGTTFRVSLPVAAAPAEQGASRAPANGRSTRNRRAAGHPLTVDNE